MLGLEGGGRRVQVHKPAQRCSAVAGRKSNVDSLEDGRPVTAVQHHPVRIRLLGAEELEEFNAQATGSNNQDDQHVLENAAHGFGIDSFPFKPVVLSFDTQSDKVKAKARDKLCE